MNTNSLSRPISKPIPVIVICAIFAMTLVNAFGARTVRAVTHLDVTRAQCERAAAVLVELLNS